MHSIEKIGPVLGIIAFLGLAVLAFLLFQQARDIRRLREWAGRAPERAEEATEAVQAATEARGEVREDVGAEAEEHAGVLGRLASAWSRVSSAVTSRLSDVDRRLPVDGRYLLALAGVAVIAAGVVTSGFGLVGGSDDGGKQGHGGGSKPKVAVLNGTGVPNLAAQVDDQVIKPAGYKASAVTNTATPGSTSTVVTYLSGHAGDAKALATAVEPKLGRTPTAAMDTEIKARAAGAPLALVIGLDDAHFGGA
jgi:hypothetical protein